MLHPRLFSILTGLGILLGTTISFAQDTEVGDRTKTVTDYSFEGDEITGDRTLPKGETVWSTTPTDRKRLVLVRTNFMPELIKSAESL